jgi:basic membrane protein A and related proteins
MQKKILKFLFIFFIFIGIIGCEKKQKNEETKKNAPPKEIIAAFIYNGIINDEGWTYSHNQGRKKLEEKLKVKTFYKESVPESPEVKDVVKAMVEQGATVIFATSFGYKKYIKELSEEYPDIKFMQYFGDEIAENIGNYFGKIEEPRFLSGIAAGMKTKTNKIGYVASYALPEIIIGINAFTLGVKSVNPTAKIYVKWTNADNNIMKEKESANSLINGGVDVITQHINTDSVIQIAEERGVWAIGYNSNIKSKSSKAYITEPIWNWGPYYIKVIESAINGNWKNDTYYGGMKDGIVLLEQLTENAPKGAAEKIAEYEAKIKDGTFNVFQGPIKDQKGIEIVKNKKIVKNDELILFNWFVQGVEGKIDNK